MDITKGTSARKLQKPAETVRYRDRRRVVGSPCGAAPPPLLPHVSQPIHSALTCTSNRFPRWPALPCAGGVPLSRPPLCLPAPKQAHAQRKQQ